MRACKIAKALNIDDTQLTGTANTIEGYNAPTYGQCRCSVYHTVVQVVPFFVLVQNQPCNPNVNRYTLSNI